MSYQTTAAIAYKPGGELTLEPVVLDDLRDDEVLVHIDACGICHTDTKFQSALPLPGVFGHEGTGVVSEIGKSVIKVKPGDRVIMGYPYCTCCPHCIIGEPYRCENIPALKFGGSRLDGTKVIQLNGEPITSSFFQQSSFARHAVTLEQALIPVNSELPPEMLAALPCGIQTGAGAILNTFKTGVNDSIVIFGAGTVGLSAVMAAHLSGAHPIICIDLHPGRLELARELGATHVFNAAEDDVSRLIKEVAPRGVQFAFDSSASVPGLENAIASIGQGGKVGIVSYPKGGENFPFSTRELFLKVGSLHAIVQGFSIPQTFLPTLIQLNENGNFPYEKLITTYSFKDINKAFDDAHSGITVKPVLLMD